MDRATSVRLRSRDRLGLERGTRSIHLIHLTGVPLPDAKPPIPPDVCGPCRFQLNRGFLGVPLFGGVAGDGLAKWFGDTKEPLLKLPKAGVPSYMGIPIDYVDDAALLVPQ